MIGPSSTSLPTLRSNLDPEKFMGPRGRTAANRGGGFPSLVAKVFSSTAKDWADRRKDLRFDLFFTPHKVPLCWVKN